MFDMFEDAYFLSVARHSSLLRPWPCVISNNFWLWNLRVRGRNI